MSAAGGIILGVMDDLPFVLAGAVLVTAGVSAVFIAAGRRKPSLMHGKAKDSAGWQPHLIEAGDGGLDRLFDGIAPRAVETAHGWTAEDEVAAEADWKAVSGKPFEIARDEAGPKWNDLAGLPVSLRRRKPESSGDPK